MESGQESQETSLFWSPSPAVIREALEGVLGSQTFCQSMRLCALLRFTVEASVHGESSSLKETVLGVQVFARAPDYDPKSDPIVRVTAARLRAKLDEYYRSEGRFDRLRIEFPKGSYRPVFRPGLSSPAIEMGGHPRNRLAGCTASVRSRLVFFRPSRRSIVAGGLSVAAIAVAIVGRPWERAAGPRVGITAVAVLPFEDLSKDPEQEFFADGMHQQLITDLSTIHALRVIARTSVMRYRGTTKPVPEIARELGVDGVVEGSVMRSGNRVRISARLIHARTESQLWAESYDRDLSEALAVQREAARTIAGEIRIAVRPEEKALLAAGRRVDPEVQELVLRGQYWANKVREEDVYKAIDYFQQAIARDVNYAPAYSGLADCYRRLATAYRPPREVQPKAKAAAQRALELDETLVDAHLTLARVLIFFDWDWPAAEKHLKRAAELSPSSAEGHVEYASYFRALGQSDRALTELRLAQALDPLSLSVETDLLFTLTAARQFDEVITQAHRVLEREPNYAWGYAFAALAHGERGEFEQATEAIEMATKIEPANTTITAFRAQVQAAKGNRREAERLIAELKAVSSRRYVCAYEVSHAYVKLGDKDEAFKWLEKGKRERAECMVWLLCEPWMDPLRGDRRYRELIEAIGLTGKVGSKP